jgi:phosphatidylethanolamine-binding protein (PEBP) family uncharacterized protein
MGMIIEGRVGKSTSCSAARTQDDTINKGCIQLNWYNYPSQSKCFVVVIDNPDEPNDPVYLLAYNIPRQREVLPLYDEGVHALEDGTTFGFNGFESLGFGSEGTKQIPGSLRLTVFALNSQGSFPAGLTHSELKRYMEGHIVDMGRSYLMTHQH